MLATPQKVPEEITGTAGPERASDWTPLTAAKDRNGSSGVATCGAIQGDAFSDLIATSKGANSHENEAHADVMVAAMEELVADAVMRETVQVEVGGVPVQNFKPEAGNLIIQQADIQGIVNEPYDGAEDVLAGPLAQLV